MPYTQDCEGECMKYHSEEAYSTGKSYTNTTPTVFKDITIPADLIRYLCDDTRRLSNSEYIYHYTTISSVRSQHFFGQSAKQHIVGTALASYLET